MPELINPPLFDHLIGANGNILKVAIFDIPSWDMDTVGNVQIDASAIPVSSRIGVIGNIWNDAQVYQFTFCNFLGSAADPDIYIDYLWQAHIGLVRKAGGWFDNTSYNDTGINRGRLIVLYVE